MKTGNQTLERRSALGEAGNQRKAVEWVQVAKTTRRNDRVTPVSERGLDPPPH